MPIDPTKPSPKAITTSSRAARLRADHILARDNSSEVPLYLYSFFRVDVPEDCREIPFFRQLSGPHLAPCCPSATCGWRGGSRPTCRFGLPCEGLRPALKQASSIAGPRRWGRVGNLARGVNTPMTSGISLQLNFTERTSGQWWSHGGAVAEDLVPSRSRDMMSLATTKCISMGGVNCASPVMPTEP